MFLFLHFFLYCAKHTKFLQFSTFQTFHTSTPKLTFFWILAFVFKKISPLLHFIMKLFKHMEKLKELYSGHPYSHHLLSVVNFSYINYAALHLFLYPSPNLFFFKHFIVSCRCLNISSCISWIRGFPGGACGKEPTCPCKRHKIPQVQSFVREDPLEKGMATHSIILAWRIPWKEKPGRPQSISSQRIRHDWSDLAHMHHELELNICLQFFFLGMFIHIIA